MRPLNEGGPSRRSRVEPFRAMAVLADANRREAAGESILHMEVGEPGGEMPTVVREAIIEALARGGLGYTEALGMPALRAAIAGLYADWYGVRVPAERIAVTAGASGAFVLALLAAFDAGARIGVTEPGYPPYKTMVRALDLAPVMLRTSPEHGFQPGPPEVTSAAPLDGLIVASPANPTGTMLEGEPRRRLLAACRASGVRLIMDEIYHGLVFDGVQTTLAGEAPDAIVINSFSKLFGLTGWRIGWAVLPEDLVVPFERLAQNLFISPPAIAQHAALAVLANQEAFAPRREAYRANWTTLADALVASGLGREAIVPAQGAFYLYADVGAFTEDSTRFCARLLAETGIAATPGLDFDAGRGHRFVRFSVAGAGLVIEAAAERLKNWLPAQRRNR
ncbi:MAG: pyridoxal phosphate-dependent aminotransferase [Pseudomonadota bacterium]